MTYSYSSFVKKIMPDFLLRSMTGMFYGWHGNYKTWSEAKAKCTGYDAVEIIEKVQAAAASVRDGKKSFERDSVVYDKVSYSYPLAASLMMIAAEKNGKLNVLDFGGSLGSTYFQNRHFLNKIEQLNWGIVEQDKFAEIGQREFSDDRLQFFRTLEACYKKFVPDLILLSSVIHYLEEPYKLLREILNKKPDYILIDRTPFIKGNDRITIQKVHPAIYKATYPCWFLNKEKFLSYMLPDYNLVFEFDALDRANIPSEFKGFLFELKK